MDDLHAAAPPDCPWWCTDTHSDEWSGGEPSKHCRRAVLGPDDVDGQPIEIELQRFASIEDERVVICEPVVSLRASGSFDIGAMRSLTETLGRLTDMAEEPGIAAA